MTYFADIQFDFRYGFLSIRIPLLNVNTPYQNVSRIKGRRWWCPYHQEFCALKQDSTHIRRKIPVEFCFLILRWLDHDWVMISKTDYILKISKLRTVRDTSLSAKVGTSFADRRRSLCRPRPCRAVAPLD